MTVPSGSGHSIVGSPPVGCGAVAGIKGRNVIGSTGAKYGDIRIRPLRRQFVQLAGSSPPAWMRLKRRNAEPFQMSAMLSRAREPKLVSLRQQQRTSPVDVTQIEVQGSLQRHQGGLDREWRR